MRCNHIHTVSQGMSYVISDTHTNSDRYMRDSVIAYSVIAYSVVE
jgi:hypothetical protein